MAEKAKPDPPYGHFGSSQYVSHSRRWQFERANVSVSSKYETLVETEAIKSRPSVGSQDREAREGPTVWRSRRHKHEISDLVKLHPELRLTVGLLDPLLCTSEAVQDAAERFSVQDGTLMAFAERAFAPLAAIVSGGGRNELHFFSMQISRKGWAASRDAWVEMPTFHGRACSWSGFALPISQILFSNAKDSGSPMVVRQSTRITILKVTTSTTDSILSVAQVATVDTARLDDTAFAHVSFNPWSRRQLGLVDVLGNWRVLELKQGHLSTSCKGSVQAASSSEHLINSDGWARLAWVNSPATIVACTRQQLRLFYITEDESKPPIQVDLGLSVASPWILDFAVLVHDPDVFLVLTSAHLILCRVAKAGLAKVQVKTEFKVRHYRHPDDMNLRFTLHEDRDVTLVTLFSSRNEVITCITIIIGDHGQAQFGQPRQVLFRSSELALRAKGISDLSILPAKIHFRRDNEDYEQLPQQVNKSSKFYIATVMYKDGRTTQTLLHHQDQVAMNAEDTPPLSWEKRVVRASHPRFVADDVDSEDDQVTGNREPRPVRRRPAHERVQRMALPKNLEALTNDLNSSIPGPLEESLTRVNSSLPHIELSQVHGIHTLKDFVQQETTFEDVENASDALKSMELRTELSENAEHEPGAVGETGVELVLDQVPRPIISRTTAPETTGALDNTYNEMVGHWIVPLSPEIPGLIRIAKDRLIRSVAAELALASRTIRLRDVADASIDQNKDELPSSGWTRLGSASSQAFPSSPLVSQYMALPTPSPTTTPSVTTASTRATFLAPEVDRLRKYAHFTKPAPPALPRSMSNVLSHWTPGAELGNYDWISTAHELSQRDEEADQVMTEKERQRMQRRAERHLRRQRKEVEASQAQRLASSQVPMLISASQPEAAKIDSQPNLAASSQYTSSQQHNSSTAFPASQPVAGKFAIRPPPKKKRKQGF